MANVLNNTNLLDLLSSYFFSSNLANKTPVPMSSMEVKIQNYIARILSNFLNVNHNPMSSMDSHSDFVLNLSTYLANKTNLNINVSKSMNSNSIVMTNISEDDLTKLPFLTNTNISNKILNIVGMSVGIPALDGSLQNLKIPGFSETMIQLFHNSDTTTFLAGNKTHIPFKSPFKGNNPSIVGDWVDRLTTSLPNLPTTTGKPKFYTIILSAVITLMDAGKLFPLQPSVLRDLPQLY